MEEIEKRNTHKSVVYNEASLVAEKSRGDRQPLFPRSVYKVKFHEILK